MTNWYHCTQLLINAVRAGEAQEVHRLIPLSYPMRHRDLGEALLYALKNNDMECVRLLAPAAEFIDINHLFLGDISVDLLNILLPWCNSSERYAYLVKLVKVSLA